MPLPFPSYLDPRGRLSQAAGVPGGAPITMFIGRDGKPAFTHQGQYRTYADLAGRHQALPACLSCASIRSPGCAWSPTATPRRAGDDLFTRSRRTAPSTRDGPRRAGRRGGTRMRAHAGRRLPARRRGRRRHGRPVRARLRPGGDRPRARAVLRLRGADDGRQPARRPRAGGGPPPRAPRRRRRRGRRVRAVRLAGALPAAARAASVRGALRGRRPARRRAARRRASPGSTVPLDLWVRTAPRGAEQFCWRIDIVPHADVGRLERGTGLHANPVRPEDAAAALRA